VNVQPVILTGKRVQLVPMMEEHIEGLYEAGRFPEIWTYMTKAVQSFEDMRNWVTEALTEKEKGTELPFTVIDLETNRIVGSTRFLNISPANRNLEIGWTWYTPAVWRTCVNTECKYLLLKHSFETLHTIRVQLKTDSRNLRSQQAIQRIGGILEGILRNDRILHDGYVRSSVYFSILAEEWPEVKKRLERFLA
jgi:RimJ/RimL family protein N-acetyltransferase